MATDFESNAYHIDIKESLHNYRKLTDIKQSFNKTFLLFKIAKMGIKQLNLVDDSWKRYVRSTGIRIL